MTMIDVDTSPLQAAREWRGIGLVHAALTSGLPVTQAEALEHGDVSQFTSIDEMIASAVVYGASLGIGRDEATALLDRTISGPSGQVQVKLPEGSADDVTSRAFSDAVRERSARMTDRPAESMQVELDAPLPDPIEDVLVLDEPVAPADLVRQLPDVPVPTAEQAIAASSEIHLDDLFGPEAPWEERAGQTGELEQWVATTDEDDFDVDSFEPVAHARTGTGAAFRARAGAACHAGLERVVGTDRADRAADWTNAGLARVADVTRTGREKLRSSEHATLIVAIGAGAMLIALLVAVGGALGGGDEARTKKVEPGTGPLVQSPSGDTGIVTPATPDADAAKPAAKAPAKEAAMVPAAKIRLNIFNAGSKKGLAKDVAAQLKGLGYGIGQVENSKGDYAGATIIHPVGMEREARLLSRHTGITTLEVAPGSTKDVTVVVV